MKKEEFISLVSKIDQTFEDEFKAEYNSPELIWERVIEPGQSELLLSFARYAMPDNFTQLALNNIIKTFLEERK